MSQTISDVFVEHLVQAGVQRIYGIVGDSLNPVVDAVRRNGKLQWIHVRHEEEAAFAAGAEAQLSGNLTACAGSCGPGNLHLINGLYDAHRSLAPVLALAAHIPSSEIGTGYFQETHPDQLFRECSHSCELISTPRQMPPVLHSARRHAARNRGPVGYSFRGKEWVEPDNPCAVGMSGLLGWGAAYKAMHECDVLLLLGTDFPYETFLPTTPRVAQVDVRAERLGRRSRLDLGLCG